MALAHERERQALQLLLKKMKFSPIVSIQGPRQCGKSYLASKLLTKKLKSTSFKTLDEKETRQFADQNPKTFLESSSAKHFIIDEVQKVPHLFDEMKAVVDLDRRPGRFVILGSTEFSIEAKIKESLTGRLSRVKIYPFNISEVLKLELSPQKNFPFVANKSRVPRKELIRYLENGGLPGIFLVKSNLEKQNLFKDWIGLTTARDIFQFKDKKLDSEIAELILSQIAILEEPTAGAIANSIGKSIYFVQKHLKALKNLFVITEVKPFAKSTGKPIYYICDVGILNYYKATLLKKLTSWCLLEFNSQLSYKGIHDDTIYYFKSSRSKPVQFINVSGSKLSAVKVISADAFDQRDLVIFDSIKNKFPKYEHNFNVIYGGVSQVKIGSVLVSPWEYIV